MEISIIHIYFRILNWKSLVKSPYGNSNKISAKIVQFMKEGAKFKEDID